MSFEIDLRRCSGVALLSLAMVSCGGGSSSNAVTPVTATAVFSLASGPYTTAQSVTITDTTSGAVIYYTTDGTTPATSVMGTTLLYAGAIPVASSAIVEAIAIAPGHSASSVSGASIRSGRQPLPQGSGWVRIQKILQSRFLDSSPLRASRFSCVPATTASTQVR